MLSRLSTARFAAARAILRPTSAVIAPTRSYATQPSGTTEANGSPVTSTSHPTVPHAPPRPTAFFARKNIGLEVTPLMAFVGVIASVALGFLAKNALTDQGIQHRHGVEEDDDLKKALAQPGGKDQKK
ncbi:hypothetical protein JCM11641_007494 [Rhodosporidiobolus odoratus]